MSRQPRLPGFQSVGPGAVLMLSLVGCPRQAPPAPPVPAAPAADVPASAPTLDAVYSAGLADARYPSDEEQSDHLVVLTRDNAQLEWSDDGRLLVTSLTRSKFYSDPEQSAPGTVLSLYSETWFTTGTEVADACSGLSGDALNLRLEQLLGLPPGGGRDVFLQVWIEPDDLMRPCANPSVTEADCAIGSPLQAQDGIVSWRCHGALDEHARWMCSTWVERYGVSDPLQQYPWTALGYTYDWADLNDPVGPSEFVAAEGTEVELVRVVPVEDFCTPVAP